MRRRDIKHYACLEQIAGFTRSTLSDGLEAGVEIIEMRSGSGLRVGVCPSRGLDISFAELHGVNLTYRHPNGAVHPAFYGAHNMDWLRGAPSGLVTTCGLQSLGPECDQGGEHFGLHDRISYLPAREVAARTLEIEGQTRFEISGEVRQTRLFGANLRLQRTISVELGQNRLQLRDTICNDGFESAPFCVLYHCNFGFPLVEAGARLWLDSHVTPRDEAAARGMENWSQIEAPQVGFAEQVFFHDIAPDAAGNCRATLWNEARKLGVSLRFRGAELPFFTQWKMLGAGAYVLGLEPSNAPLASRSESMRRGAMPVLEAGESRDFPLDFSFLSGDLESPIRA